MNNLQERTIEMYLEDKPGVLNRVVSLSLSIVRGVYRGM